MAFESEIDDELERILLLVNENRRVGLRELEQHAVAGNKSAILFLGLYLSEESETEDEAIKWLKLANNFDSADAAWNLAMIARSRDNLADMRSWIDRAARLGEEDALEIQKCDYDVASVLAKYSS